MSFELHRVFATSVFDGEEEHRLVRLLEAILWTCMVTASLIFLASLAYKEWEVCWALLIAITLLGFGLWLVRRGARRFVGIALSLGILILIGYFHFIGQGIHDVGTIMYPLALIVGSLVVSRRSYILLVGLAITMVWAVVFAEVNARSLESKIAPWRTVTTT